MLIYSRLGSNISLFQRIVGKNIDRGLKFFGRAIFGDLGEDGLPGVVVESHGAAVVFR